MTYQETCDALKAIFPDLNYEEYVASDTEPETILCRSWRTSNPRREAGSCFRTDCAGEEEKAREAHLLAWRDEDQRSYLDTAP